MRIAVLGVGMLGHAGGAGPAGHVGSLWFPGADGTRGWPVGVGQRCRAAMGARRPPVPGETARGALFGLPLRLGDTCGA